jgi:hypothetical protein
MKAAFQASLHLESWSTPAGHVQLLHEQLVVPMPFDDSTTHFTFEPEVLKP